MKQFFKEISLNTQTQTLVDITSRVKQFVAERECDNGIVHISCLHTSASLVVQENASSDVLIDLKNFFNQLVPMNNSLYNHTIEGIDDMPAHIKSALTQNHLTLSIQNHLLQLGIWQGIFLFEHRLNSQRRKILLHLIGE